MLVRLHKYLADRGVASRRKCEQYIKEGLVKVNGKVIKKMGVKIMPGKDKITLSPLLKMKKQKFVYYAFHKPVGYICAITGKEKPKIMELLKDISYRIFPVGRLDKLTSGLLFLTNDGRFAYKLTHPKFEKEKEYVIKTKEKITPKIIKKLTESFYIHGYKIAAPRVSQQAPHVFRVILKEGRNRQIRRMCERAELHIEKLKRVRIGRLVLGDLKSGEYRKLNVTDLKKLDYWAGGGTTGACAGAAGGTTADGVGTTGA